MARNSSVLVVDDEFLVAELLTIMLREMGLKVCGTAATADDAVTLAETHVPRLVLMDVRLPGPRDGIEAAKAIRHTTDAQVIFITGSGDPATIARIEQNHPALVLCKPIWFDQLRSAVLNAIR